MDCKKLIYEVETLLGLDDILVGRMPEKVMARNCIIKLLKDATSMSVYEIGQHLGGRCHATVLHALKTNDSYNYYPKLRSKFKKTTAFLNDNYPNQLKLQEKRQRLRGEILENTKDLSDIYLYCVNEYLKKLKQ